LEKKSLREQALAALRMAITSGELEPGRHLVETELSEMLQISRGTLREALRQLEQEGLISAGARGRMSVRHLDVKEIRDIFAVRGVLESLAARTLSDMPDKEAALAELRAAVDNMEKAAKSSWRNGSNPTLSSTAPCAACRATKRCCTRGNPWRAPSGCPSCSPGWNAPPGT
jgi:DNA-binding GntR family transcriptional regulator